MARCLRWFAALLFIALFDAAPAPAAGDEESLLSEERWRDSGYGLSLRPPADARLFERYVDDPLPWSLGQSGQPRKLVMRPLGNRLRVMPLAGLLQQSADEAGEDRQLLEQIRGRRALVTAEKATFIAHKTDKALLLMAGKPGELIRLYVFDTTVPLAVSDFAALMVTHVGVDVPSALILKKKLQETGGRPGALVYYRLPDPGRRDLLLGQAMMQVHDKTFAMLQLEGPHVMAESLQPKFEAVAASMAVDAPDQLDQLRRGQIQRGVTWRQLIDTDQLHEAIEPRQLFRIIEADRDIGYMTIDMTLAQKDRHFGIEVVVRARLHEGPHVQDTLSEFFLADDDSYEVWSIRTTARAHAPADGRPLPDEDAPAAGPGVITWAETGWRIGDTIEVKRPGRADQKTRRWTRPEGYLSQVELHLIESLLPQDTEQTLGFYAYLPTANKLTYRTISIAPLPDFGYRLFTQAGPGRGQVMSQYDPVGRVVGRRYSGGRAMLVTSEKEFRKIWNVRAGRGR